MRLTHRAARGKRDVVMLSTHERSGGAQLFSESLATFGLITVIVSVSRNRPSAVPFAVGAGGLSYSRSEV
jgi:hypothetical protein